jgi:hypothetical protein
LRAQTFLPWPSKGAVGNILALYPEILPAAVGNILALYPEIYRQAVLRGDHPGGGISPRLCRYVTRKFRAQNTTPLADARFRSSASGIFRSE